MEKRHQVTKIEKYEEIVSANSEREFTSNLVLTISAVILYSILPYVGTKTWAPIALGACTGVAIGSLHSMIDAIVKKVVYQGKLDDLNFEKEQELIKKIATSQTDEFEYQEENQSRSR